MLRDSLDKLRESLGEARTRVETLARTASQPDRGAHTEVAEPAEDPPVGARLVVEIRSDGLRTIARGALEDAASGERVGIDARGSSPAQLAASLARSLLTAPLLARQMRAFARLRPRGPGQGR